MTRRRNSGVDAKLRDGIVEEIRSSVFYHGTSVEFQKFNIHYFGQTDRGYYGIGFYFTPSEQEASEYGSIVLTVELHISNPFVILESPESDHLSLLAVRDSLASLSEYKHLDGLAPNRELSAGYYVQKKEYVDEGYAYRTFRGTLYSVYPVPELYGTDAEIYGPEAQTPEQAIVKFNEQVSGNAEYDVGWASDLLKRVGRGRDYFSDALTQDGYDSVVVVNADKLYIGEIMVINQDNIEILDVRR